MLNTHVDYGLDVIVVQGIDHRFADFSVFNKSRVFEYAKLVGDCRHTHRKLFRDVANAHFAFKKQIKYLDSCAVAHYREKFCQVEEMLVVGKSDLIDYFVMCLVIVADGGGFVIVLHYTSP